MNVTRRQMLKQGAMMFAFGGLSALQAQSETQQRRAPTADGFHSDSVPCNSMPCHGKQDETWSLQPALPLPIQEIYPAVFEREIYVGGGFAPSHKPAFHGLAPSTELFIFNPASAVWRSGPLLPEARHHLGMVSDSKHLFAIGGFYGVNGYAWQARDTVFKLASGAQHWEAGPALPVPVGEAVYANLNDNLHVVGGRTPGQKNTRRLQDIKRHFALIAGQHWEEVAPASVARNSAAAGVIDNRLYVVGGRAAGEYHLNKHYAEVYDPTRDKWTSIRPLPEALAGLAAAVLDAKLYVFGGERFGDDRNWKSGTVLNSVWCYDPHTDEWQRKAAMLHARHGHGAVACANKIYVIGGGVQPGPSGTTASVHSLNIG